jgi:DNA-binding PadR family transcriptional regulator
LLLYKFIGCPIVLNNGIIVVLTMSNECCPENEICPPGCCDMRGMLSFIILWLLNKRSMFGDEIANEIGRMKGGKPTPGTIYPALKQLKQSGAVTSKKKGRKVVYSLTKKGEHGAEEALKYFCTAFGPIFEDYQKQRLIPLTSIR